MKESLICANCSTPNEPGRDICWQCFRSLAVVAPGPEYLSERSSVLTPNPRTGSLLPPVRPIEEFSAANVDYAGFWVRVWASVIDSFFISLIIGPLILALVGVGAESSKARMQGPAGILVTWVVPIVVIFFFWVNKGATPGKIMLGLRIVDAETFGEPNLTSWVMRCVGYILCSMLLCVGYVWVAFDPKKQGWHDKMAHTVVAYTRSLPRIPRPASNNKPAGMILGATIMVGVLVAGFIGINNLSKGALRLKRSAEDTKKDAVQFGQIHDSQECLMEALGRDADCADFGCHINAKVFLEESLKVAARPHKFCLDIPRSSDVINSSLWKHQQCKQRNRDDSYCIGLFEAMQTACEQRFD